MRSPSSRGGIGLLASLAVIPMGACALEPGDPWGRVVLELHVETPLPEARRVNGQWLTARDYLVVVERFEVAVDAVALAASSGAAAFSPDSPPEGYSLCHNGHCHAADGRLVPYEDIALELQSGGGGALVDATGGAVSLAPDTSAVVPLEGCSRVEPCIIDAPVAVPTALASGVHLRVTGRVFEGRPAGLPRLHEDGMPFEIEAHDVDLATQLDIAFGPGEPLERLVALTLRPPASLFDDVDWAAADALLAAPAQLASRLAEGRALSR